MCSTLIRRPSTPRTATTTAAAWLRFQNRNLEKGRAGYDRTHRIVGTLNYELPFWQGKKYFASGWEKTVLGGFELSWIQTQESGNPINFGLAGSPYNITTIRASPATAARIW